MRLIKYDGAEYLLTEKNWKQMLHRFDASRATLNAFGHYFVHGSSICVARDYKCIRCPLRDAHKKVNSCTYLFEHIIGDDLLPYVHLRDSGILWLPEDDAKAREALGRVVNVLLEAETVPATRKRKTVS